MFENTKDKTISEDKHEENLTVSATLVCEKGRATRNLVSHRDRGSYFRIAWQNRAWYRPGNSAFNALFAQWENHGGDCI